MRKVVFECVGNALLFSLMGLAFMFPFSRYEGSVSASGFSFDVHLSPFMVALLAFLALYAVVRHAFVKRNGLRAHSTGNLELVADDERELQLSGRALKSAYRVLMTCLIVGLGVLAGAQFLFSAFLSDPVAVYRTAVGIIAATLVASSVSYCARWCLEFGK
ncbi:hypothetical protein C1878_04310 [Gordonibacter sp. 28C]|uniref:hypothetical protein n=1 Tax=Gordonibacter sp. 28C TaxID=2078569 RepID=UPI000DF7F0ED|nr:hypothetical protein [Gordonibacter sp. 28C]RDB63102.1 hypothetical protein C1878_04310 [Gordonibacter sp. 28C]